MVCRAILERGRSYKNVLCPSGSRNSRFAFTGGNNVTLRGSLDPEWGWVDAHGQAVSPEYVYV